MAARIMLKRRGVGSVLHFGAAKGENKPFDAHAWLDAAGVEVTGYPVAKNFAESPVLRDASSRGCPWMAPSFRGAPRNNCMGAIYK